jgi:hypothetical protein
MRDGIVRLTGGSGRLKNSLLSSEGHPRNTEFLPLRHHRDRLANLSYPGISLAKALRGFYRFKLKAVSISSNANR